MSDSGVPAGPDLGGLVDRVEVSLLGGERRYTRTEVAERAGISSDKVRALWRALGFATVDDDEQRAFTEADVEALRKVGRLASLADLDDDVLRAMTRMIGQSFARLASWQGQLVLETVSRSPQLLADGNVDQVLALVDELTPLTAALHEYVWRRQLAAYFSRTTAAGAGRERTRAVGFADMASFTAFTRRASEAELRGVLERFESLATDVVGQHHGEIVKTIGDEVLYVADDPVDAAEIALTLVEASEQDEALPHLRVGLAAGPVVSRLGDVFGQTVNIASRLTSAARTASVLVDQGMVEALEGDERFALHPLRPLSVRGYQHLRAWRLRRAASG